MAEAVGDPPGERPTGLATIAAERDGRDARRSRPGVDAWLIGAVVIGAALRLRGLGTQSLWYDEWLTREDIDDGWRKVVPNVVHDEGLPAPYFVGLWAWTRVVGLGEAALRLPSALAGIATVPVAYAAARELHLSRRTARVAALLVAVHPALVWYSQEARPYSLLALAGALSLWALARALDDGRTRSYVLWGVTGGLLVACHYYGIFLVAAGAVVLSIARPAGRRQLLLGCVPPAAAAAVLGPLALRQRAHDPGGWIDAFPLAERLEEAGTGALVGPSPFDRSLWVPVGAVVLVAVGVLAGRIDAEGRRAALLVAGGIGVGSIALALAADVAGLNAFVSRYALAALVPLIVAAAAALTGLRPRLAAPFATGVVAAVMLVTVSLVPGDPDLQKPAWRDVADVARTGSERSLVVMTMHGRSGLPLRDYLDATTLDEGETAAVDQIDIVFVNRATRPCNALVGRACGLIFLGAPLPDDLADRFALAERIELDQFTVERYRARSPVRLGTADVVAPGDPSRSPVLVPGPQG